MSALQERIDPELRLAFEQVREVAVNDIQDIVQRRAVTAAIIATTARLEASATDEVGWHDEVIEDHDGLPRLRVRVYRPTRGPAVGNVLFVHSGGMIIGDLDFEHASAVTLCAQTRTVVVSVDYRLAPENPYPAGLEDCLAAYRWMRGSTHIDPDAPWIFYGHSAGGGLILATALRARDAREPLPDLVMAIYPMIDDRPTASSEEISGVGVWDSHHNQEGWRLYLQGATPDQYAAPARAADLRALPPTFIDVGELDVFRDESVAFAQRLMQAGVPTELHVYPGAFHGSEGLVPEADISRRTVSTRLHVLRRSLGTAKHPDGRGTAVID